MSTKEALEQQMKAYVGVVQGPVEVAQDAVNEAMIRHWCEAMGDRNPAYLDADAAKRSVHGGIVAPPVMLQAWILGGLASVLLAAGAWGEAIRQDIHHARESLAVAVQRLDSLSASMAEIKNDFGRRLDRMEDRILRLERLTPDETHKDLP